MTLSLAQENILRSLDGRWSALLLNGHSLRPLRTLRDMGMVEYVEEVHNVRTFAYKRTRTLYRVILTNKGQDFIYNGGIDH